MMPRPPQPRPTSGPPVHREDAVALEADIADRDLVARKLLLRRRFDDRRAGASAKQQRGRVALWIAADEQHFLALLRHHVREIGESKTLADAALAVDRDDLCVFGRGRRRRIWFYGGFLAQKMRGRIGEFVGGEKALRVIHATALQSRTIFRQRGSSKAIG